MTEAGAFLLLFFFSVSIIAMAVILSCFAIDVVRDLIREWRKQG